MTTTREEVHALLVKWEHEGLLSHDQADRIEAAELHEMTGIPMLGKGHVGARAKAPVIAEALGYVGAALVLAAFSLIAGQFWADLSSGVRVGAFGLAAVAVLALGNWVADRASGPAERMRAVAWALSVAALVGAVITGVDAWTDLRSSAIVLAGFAPAAVYSAVLWRFSGAVLLHLSTFVTLAVVAGTMGDQWKFVGDETSQTCVFLLALAWVALTYAGRIEPRAVGIPLGSLVGIVAAQATTGVLWGLALGLVVTSSVVILSVYERNLVLLGVGALGVFMTVPAAVERYIHGPTGAGLGLLIAGVVLIGAAVVILRRQRPAS